jgi:hypothetical protein
MFEGFVCSLERDSQFDLSLSETLKIFSVEGLYFGKFYADIVLFKWLHVVEFL